MGKPRAQRTRWFDESEKAERPCDVPGCDAPGMFRAPRSRDSLDAYFWFCRDHVQAYNKAWNYYAGMSEEEVEAATRADTTWQRPTWPLGGRAARARLNGGAFADAFGLFGRGASGGRADEKAKRQPPPNAAPAPEREALTILELESDADSDTIKARYRELVKLHHPDANGGDKTAEERLKSINQAYHTLRNAFGF